MFEILKVINKWPFGKWEFVILLNTELDTFEDAWSQGLKNILNDLICHVIQKQRHYFANKGPSSQGYGFSSGHCGCESWTVKKAERQRIDAFELWC